MADAPTPPVLRYDYIKGNLYRIVHADGVVGGIAPSGNLVFSFFNERLAIPQQVTHSIVLEGEGVAKIAEEIRSQRVTRESLVREVEVGIVMDFNNVESLHRWLGEQLEKLRSVDEHKKRADRSK